MLRYIPFFVVTFSFSLFCHISLSLILKLIFVNILVTNFSTNFSLRYFQVLSLTFSCLLMKESSSFLFQYISLSFFSVLYLFNILSMFFVFATTVERFYRSAISISLTNARSESGPFLSFFFFFSRSLEFFCMIRSIYIRGLRLTLR